MRRKFPLWVGPVVLATAACTTSPSETYLARYAATNTRALFTVCSGFGCAHDTAVHLAPDEWGEVRHIFAEVPADAAEERNRIRAAIARLETLVGAKAGTANDAPGAAIIALDTRGQMDCIDEAYNTSTYLRLLAEDGLLRFHSVGQPVLRGHLIDRWPHNTATIADTGTGSAYAVDSWFHGNGQAPEIVPLDMWLAGWSPERRRT
jgi:hypothetical protein